MEAPRAVSPGRNERAWFGHVTGHGAISLAYADNNDTEPIALTPAGACRFIARSDMSTPGAVIIAALAAAGPSDRVSGEEALGRNSARSTNQQFPGTWRPGLAASMNSEVNRCTHR